MEASHREARRGHYRRSRHTGKKLLWLGKFRKRRASSKDAYFTAENSTKPESGYHKFHSKLWSASFITTFVVSITTMQPYSRRFSVRGTLTIPGIIDPIMKGSCSDAHFNSQESPNKRIVFQGNAPPPLGLGMGHFCIPLRGIKHNLALSHICRRNVLKHPPVCYRGHRNVADVAETCTCPIWLPFSFVQEWITQAAWSTPERADAHAVVCADTRVGYQVHGVLCWYSPHRREKGLLAPCSQGKWFGFVGLKQTRILG